MPAAVAVMAVVVTVVAAEAMAAAVVAPVAADAAVTADMLPPDVGSLVPSLPNGSGGEHLMGLPLRDAREIFEHFHFEDFVQQLAAANLLYQVVQRFAVARLSPADISNRGMGIIFEELIRKFNEENNEEAGEHFTPREVIEKGLKVADATAFSLCMDNGMPMLVFNLLTEGNIARAVAGEKIGTLVSS